MCSFLNCLRSLTCGWVLGSRSCVRTHVHTCTRRGRVCVLEQREPVPGVRSSALGSLSLQTAAGPRTSLFVPLALTSLVKQRDPTRLSKTFFPVLHSANMYASCQMYTKYVIYIYLEYIKNEHKFRFFCVLK